MMHIKCLRNGSYSLKHCYNPIGKALHTPPHGKMLIEHLKSLRGASLCWVGTKVAWELSVHFESITSCPFEDRVADRGNHWHIIPKQAMREIGYADHICLGYHRLNYIRDWKICLARSLGDPQVPTSKFTSGFVPSEHHCNAMILSMQCIDIIF